MTCDSLSQKKWEYMCMTMYPLTEAGQNDDKKIYINFSLNIIGNIDYCV